jgi:hypothetical protein
LPYFQIVDADGLLTVEGLLSTRVAVLVASLGVCIVIGYYGLYMSGHVFLPPLVEAVMSVAMDHLLAIAVLLEAVAVALSVAMDHLEMVDRLETVEVAVTVALGAVVETVVVATTWVV